jgi:DNA repair protein RadD
MWASHHQAAGKTTPVLKITYKTGNKMINEFLCFEHSGYARQKAVKIWNEMVTGDSLRKSPPATVDEALFRQLEMKTPDKIKVDFSGKFPNIVNRMYGDR